MFIYRYSLPYCRVPTYLTKRFPISTSFQVAIFSVTLAPIRLILILILSCFNVFLYSLLRVFSTAEEMEKTFKKSWQKNIIAVLSFSSRLQLFLFSIIITEKGRLPPPDEAPIIIAAPHVGWLDAWLSHTCCSRKMVLYYTV